MRSKTEHDIALSKAKINLMAKPDSVFFTTLCFSLKTSFCENTATASTNGTDIRINPSFFLSLDPEERIFLLLHETMHCAYMHMTRAKALNLDMRKANVAADHVINLQLIERGFKMPQNGLADPQYKGMDMETVYRLLPEDVGPPPMDDLGDPGEDISETENNITDILVKAAMQSKMANDRPGTIPGEIEIFLNKLLNPKLDWKKLLRNYLNQFSKNDYSWRKPNRRFFPRHYLPSLYSEVLMDVAIAVDASGSVTDEEFLQFVSEINSIFRMMKPPKLTLIQFDHKIQAIDVIRNMGDLSRVKFSGRGGTKIRPVFNWIEENKPQLIIVFTDGGFRMPDVKLPGQLLWLIHNNPGWKSTVGKVIHYTL